MIRRPAPWASTATRYYFAGGPAALVVAGWVTAAVFLAFLESFVVAGAVGASASVAAVVWRLVAHRSPDLRPFADAGEWQASYDAVVELRDAPGLAPITWDVWEGLSAASVARAGWHSLRVQAVLLAEDARAQDADEAATIELAVEVVAKLRSDLQERARS